MNEAMDKRKTIPPEQKQTKEAGESPHASIFRSFEEDKDEGGVTMSARELLLEYTLLLNKFGVESMEAQNFLEENKTNLEFVNLAETARWLKKALTPNGNMFQNNVVG